MSFIFSSPPSIALIGAGFKAIESISYLFKKTNRYIDQEERIFTYGVGQSEFLTRFDLTPLPKEAEWLSGVDIVLLVCSAVGVNEIPTRLYKQAKDKGLQIVLLVSGTGEHDLPLSDSASVIITTNDTTVAVERLVTPFLEGNLIAIEIEDIERIFVTGYQGYMHTVSGVGDTRGAIHLVETALKDFEKLKSLSSIKSGFATLSAHPKTLELHRFFDFQDVVKESCHDDSTLICHSVASTSVPVGRYEITLVLMGN